MSQQDTEGLNLQQWPPGTVLLEKLMAGHQNGRIILHPTPSSDPNDPLNWSMSRKVINFALVCYYALIIFAILDISTVIYGDLNAELGFSFTSLNRSFAIGCAGLAFGCIIFIPFALKFGRRPIYLVSIAISLATGVWQARMETLGDLFGASLVGGLAGSISETLCEMTVADMFFVHQRASATGCFLIMVNASAFLAPVAAGYSAVSQGWRWIWWWCTIFLGVALFLFLFFYEETKYIPVVHGEAVHEAGDIVEAQNAEKTSASKYVTESMATVTSRTTRSDIPIKPYTQRMALLTTTPGGFSKFFCHTYQPFIILLTFPAVTIVALVYGSLLAWFSIALSVLSIYFTLPPYNFSSAGIGLLNLAPFIGAITGSIYGGLLSDFTIVRLARRNRGVFEPEMRLWLGLPAVLITPMGFFMFGFSLAHGKPWIISALGIGIFGFGLTALADVTLTYLLDSYKDIIGDTFIALAFVRNALGALVTLVLTPWIEAMGLYNLFVLSGCLSLGIFLLIVPMIIWGRKSRIWTTRRYAAMAARQFDTRTPKS